MSSLQLQQEQESTTPEISEESREGFHRRALETVARGSSELLKKNWAAWKEAQRIPDGLAALMVRNEIYSAPEAMYGLTREEVISKYLKECQHKVAGKMAEWLVKREESMEDSGFRTYAQHSDFYQHKVCGTR